MARRAYILLFAGMILAAIGLWRFIKSNPEPDRISEVQGFLKMDNLRLDFVDGVLVFDTEPLEWHRYGLECRLSHDLFTSVQMRCIRRRSGVDLNRRTIPPGFPGPKANGDGPPIPPSVSLTIGTWPTATLPQNSKLRVGIYVGYFALDSDSTSFGVSPEDVQSCHIDTSGVVSIAIHTKGQEDAFGHHYEWDITFTGKTYDDPWPLHETWEGRGTVNPAYYGY